MRTVGTEQHGVQESKETGEMEGKGGGIGNSGNKEVAWASELLRPVQPWSHHFC